MVKFSPFFNDIYVMRATRAPLTRAKILEKYPALKKQSFFIKGTLFLAAKSFVTKSLLASLGINPRFYKPGAKIYLLKEKSHKLLSTLCGFGRGNEGMYPLAKKGDTALVLQGKIDRLPNESRIVCLPRNHDKRALTHELLHDIFIGGGLSKIQRDSFIGNLAKWRKAAESDPSRKAEARFYQLVARSTIKESDPAIYAGEAFVYAAEFYFGYSNEAEVGRIPREILNFFEEIRLMA